MAIIAKTNHRPKTQYASLAGESAADVRRQMRELRRFQRSTRFVARHRPKLTRHYPDKWIAVRDAEVAFTATSFDVLVRKVRRAGLHLGDFHVAFLNTKPEIWIL